MKAILLASAVAVAGVASASFDLILIADAGLGVVHRYDGDSGVYLGSFGGGALVNCKSIAVDKNLNRAYVGGANNGQGVGVYNYNTGEFIGYNSTMGSFVQDLAVTSAGTLLGTALGPSSTSVRRQNSVPFGNSQTSFLSPTTFDRHSAVGEDASGKILAVNPINGSISRWSPTDPSAPEQTRLESNLIGAAGGDISGNHMVVIRQNGQMLRITTTGSIAVLTGFNLAVPMTSAVDAAYGHENNAWGLGMNGTSTRLQMYARSSGGLGAFYDPYGPGRTLSQVQTPVGMAVVLAPEPGTMLALGAGAVALLRKRRRA